MMTRSIGIWTLAGVLNLGTLAGYGISEPAAVAQSATAKMKASEKVGQFNWKGAYKSLIKEFDLNYDRKLELLYVDNRNGELKEAHDIAYRWYLLAFLADVYGLEGEYGFRVEHEEKKIHSLETLKEAYDIYMKPKFDTDGQWFPAKQQDAETVATDHIEQVKDLCWIIHDDSGA